MPETEFAAIKVRNRAGVLTDYKPQKIRQAVKLCLVNGCAMHDDKITEQLAEQVTSRVERIISKAAGPTSVEQIQDLIEQVLMGLGEHDAAKQYILYREEHRRLREDMEAADLMPDSNALGDYIHPGKYARYRPELKRREVYAETVERLESMHLRRFADMPEVCDEITKAFKYVYRKEILPSMRSMQFGGIAAEKNHARLFNCTASYCDRISFFSEGMWLLLSGSGIGFSVQTEHVEKLPALKYINTNNVRHHVIADSIEGWADAVHRLFDSYVKGYYVEFAYNKIRAKGSPLLTSGGKAPGHKKLKESLERVRAILDAAQGRQLRSIECYDAMCHIAGAVLSGGIRRSAMICLFSLEDGDMMNAKPKDYWRDLPGRPATPWRAFSNNSVMLKRDEVNKKTFRRIFKMTQQCGEPGFYFCDDFSHLSNPCVEIGLDSTLHINAETLELMQQWLDDAKHGRGLLIDDDQSKVIEDRTAAIEWAQKHQGEKTVGWSFCNLTTQNAAKFETAEDMMRCTRAATVIGTLQASYTRYPYLGWVSEIISRRDALIGVSMTGMMANTDIALNADTQRKAVELCIETNRRIAKMIGIRPAARTTCVKPEGTGSKELGIPFEGIHGAHAKRFVQCVLANEDEAVFKHFYKTNSHMCVKVPGGGDWAIYFPMAIPDGAITRDDLTAIQFLEKVLSTQKNWVLPGTARPDQTPGLTNNVSNTVTVRDHEWDDVADFIYEHKQFFTGLSFLSHKSDKEYGPFAPKQSVQTPEDKMRWEELVRQYQPVDYSTMVEEDDNTEHTAEAACAGGTCV